jgi:protein with PEP-CTERM/exosortase system signal
MQASLQSRGANQHLRRALSLFGGLLLLSLTPTAPANSITGDITIGGSARFNKTALTKASNITGWMTPLVLSDGGFFSPFAAPGSDVTMSTPWFFGSSSSSFVLWSVGGFTFDLTSSSLVSRSKKSLSVAGIGTVTGNGFDDATGDWTFTFNQGKGRRHPSSFLFSFSGIADIVTPPPSGTPTPPPSGTPTPPPSGTPTPPPSGTPTPPPSGITGTPPPNPGTEFPPTQNVPDGGSTFGLLGLALAVMASVRRLRSGRLV